MDRSDHHENKPIFCMEHCKDVKLFGFNIPRNCSCCGAELAISDLNIPPFRIPTPFYDAAQCPCSIVLKPNVGSFLKDYKNSDNLHIGVTSSLGIVHEYNWDGLRTDKTSEWTQCIPIQNIFLQTSDGNPRQHVPEHDCTFMKRLWDFTLLQMTGQQNGRWGKTSYNEWSCNCYKFVMCFLQSLHERLVASSPNVLLNYSSNYERNSISSTEKFCESYIIRKTTAAAKYITLYRQLIHNVPS